MSEEAQPKKRALTDKERVWVEAYIGIARFNATEAARIAGYKDVEVSGFENKQKPELREVIDTRLAEMTLSANEVLAGLSEHATASLEQFLTIDKRGVVKTDLRKAQRAGKMHLLKSYERGKHGPKLTLVDSQDALVKIGSYHKLFVERKEYSGPGGAPIEVRAVDYRDAIKPILHPDFEEEK